LRFTDLSIDCLHGRAEAEHALLAAQQLPDDQSRAGLIKLAGTLQERALELDQRAARLMPPLIQKHQIPQQMQQTQLAPKNPDNDDPENSS
jgi:hypothetical protein